MEDLKFKKDTLIELNPQNLREVNSGFSTIACVALLTAVTKIDIDNLINEFKKGYNETRN